MITRANGESSLFMRILQFPVTRLVILIAIIFYLYISGHIFRAQYAHNPIMNVVVVLWMILITMSIYAAFVRYVERRPVSELATPGMGREFGMGLLMGFNHHRFNLAHQGRPPR
jgi:cytochrome c biogenesis protein CcdA